MVVILISFTIRRRASRFFLSFSRALSLKRVKERTLKLSQETLILFRVLGTKTSRKKKFLCVKSFCWTVQRERERERERECERERERERDFERPSSSKKKKTTRSRAREKKNIARERERERERSFFKVGPDPTILRGLFKRGERDADTRARSKEIRIVSILRSAAAIRLSIWWRFV